MTTPLPPSTASSTASSTAPAVGARPRVQGDREQEILAATLEVLADVGYDRLTMDAVAARAKASKATLYRRLSSKARLVVDALHAAKGPAAVPDTGTLREDLRQLFCGLGPDGTAGLMDPQQVALFASVLTAVGRDADFAAAFRETVVAAKAALAREVWERARERGEVREDADLDLLAAALPGIVLHRVFVLGEEPSPELVTRVIDHVVLPAATSGR